MADHGIGRREEGCLVCLSAHTSHLLQPLGVGVFGLLAKNSKLHVDRIAQLSVRKVVKMKFLELYDSARSEAYTQSNLAGGWGGSGIEPFDPSVPISHVSGTGFTTPPQSHASSTPLCTPWTTNQVHRLVDVILDKDSGPTTQRYIQKLAKGVK